MVYTRISIAVPQTNSKQNIKVRFKLPDGLSSYNMDHFTRRVGAHEAWDSDTGWHVDDR